MKKPKRNQTQIVKASREVTDIQSVQDFEAAAEGLNEAQMYALKAIASFVKPAEILGALDEVEAGQITRSWVEKQSSPAKRTPRCRAMVEYFRRQMTEELGEIPITSPSYRLRELQKIADTTQDERVKLVALKEAHLQTEALNKRTGGKGEVPFEKWQACLSRPVRPKA
jgi:hypothetical protein